MPSVEQDRNPLWLLRKVSLWKRITVSSSKCPIEGWYILRLTSCVKSFFFNRKRDEMRRDCFEKVLQLGGLTGSRRLFSFGFALMLTRGCESAEEDSESHIERGLCGSFKDLVRGKNFLNEMIFYFTFTYENTFLKAF